MTNDIQCILSILEVKLLNFYNLKQNLLKQYAPLNKLLDSKEE